MVLSPWIPAFAGMTLINISGDMLIR